MQISTLGAILMGHLNEVLGYEKALSTNNKILKSLHLPDQDYRLQKERKIRSYSAAIGSHLSRSSSRHTITENGYEGEEGIITKLFKQFRSEYVI